MNEEEKDEVLKYMESENGQRMLRLSVHMRSIFIFFLTSEENIRSLIQALTVVLYELGTLVKPPEENCLMEEIIEGIEEIKSAEWKKIGSLEEIQKKIYESWKTCLEAASKNVQETQT